MTNNKPTPPQYMEIDIDLYTEDEVLAAQEALGKKLLTDTAVEIYLTCIKKQQNNQQASLKQYEAASFTHKKISKWKDALGDIGTPTTLRTLQQATPRSDSDQLRKNFEIIEAILKQSRKLIK